MTLIPSVDLVAPSGWLDRSGSVVLSWEQCDVIVTLAIKASKLGSGRNDLFDINFLRHVGHSLLLSNATTTSTSP